jgi:uroporphyrinogen decarboxylase
MTTLIHVLRGQKTKRIPIWLMRQAGRYLPEYRALRARKNGFMDMALDPESACEITMQPIRRFNMSGAIIFSDILMVPYGLGQSVDFQAGEGPILGAYDFQSLSQEYFLSRLAPVFEALKLTRSALSSEGFSDTALLGFCGAPWTVACYMIEGGSSKDFSKIKTFASAQPDDFQKLIDLLVEASIVYLSHQIEAGAQAVQIFESWASALCASQFTRWSIQPTQKIVKAIQEKYPHCPVIGFPRGAGVLYPEYLQQTGINAIGVDFQLPTKWVQKNLQQHKPVQGNLDPMILRAGGKALDLEIETILKDLSGAPFVFNLGHGVHKDTPPEHVAQLIKRIEHAS